MSKESTNDLEEKVKNATPGELVVMLYDGLIQFCSQAEKLLQDENAENFTKAEELLVRSQKIVETLKNSLNKDQSPELTEKLTDLYDFFTDQFHSALKDKSSEPIKNIIPLIKDLRETWNKASNQGS